MVSEDISLDLTQKDVIITPDDMKRATIKAYENLNHLFQDCSREDSRLNYAGIRQTMAPQVLEDVVNWLVRTAQ